MVYMQISICTNRSILIASVVQWFESWSRNGLGSNPLQVVPKVYREFAMRVGRGEINRHPTMHCLQITPGISIHTSDSLELSQFELLIFFSANPCPYIE